MVNNKVNLIYEQLMNQLKELKYEQITPQYFKSIKDDLIKNNKNDKLSEGNIEKLQYPDDKQLFFVIKENNQIKGLLTIIPQKNNILYFHQLFSFEKHGGYGLKLFDYVFNKFNNFDCYYMTADWSQSINLVNYYRKNYITKYGFKEQFYLTDKKEQIYMFYLNKNLNKEQLERFLNHPQRVFGKRINLKGKVT